MTGLASIEFRNEEDLLKGKSDVRAFYIAEVMPKKLEIELRYISHQGLMLDLSILLRTLLAVLKR
jgi:lipopolysaccharide/colanic/teichoic acid biosynthesis glycosyltransferase